MGDTVQWFTFAIAILSLVVSAITWWGDRPQARLERERHSAMRTVAARALVLWDRFRNSTRIVEAVQHDAKHLEDALYAAMKCGVWEDLVGTKERAGELYMEFLICLTWIHSLPPYETKTVVKSHFNPGRNCYGPLATRGSPYMGVPEQLNIDRGIYDASRYPQTAKVILGLTRILDQCRIYERSRPQSFLSSMLVYAGWKKEVNLDGFLAESLGVKGAPNTDDAWNDVWKTSSSDKVTEAATDQTEEEEQIKCDKIPFDLVIKHLHDDNEHLSSVGPYVRFRKASGYLKDGYYTSATADDITVLFALCNALKANTRCMELDLHDWKINDNGAETIAEMLKINKGLRTVNLKDNSIGPKGATALAHALSENTNIQSLNLARNEIGDEGAKAFAKTIEKSKYLVSLSLDSNDIELDIGQDFADALQHDDLRGLRELYLDCVGNEGSIAFARALKTNKRLQKLTLGSIGEDGAVAIREALVMNGTLEFIDFDEEDVSLVLRNEIYASVEKNRKRNSARREREATIEKENAAEQNKPDGAGGGEEGPNNV